MRAFATTSARGLDHSSFPMRLYHKAKKLGTWDPRDIDFSRDIEDWQRLAPEEKDVLLRLTTLFQGGEEAVTLDLLPLIQAVAADGRLEEEMYLTSFLFEEAKHVESFRRFFDEVAQESSDLSRYFTPSWERIFFEELPAALGRLRVDTSPEAMADASVTYNMIVEGVLAETGYHAYHEALTRNGIMPGMQEVARLLKQDESRHLAYGVYLLARLVAEHGAPIHARIQERMAVLLMPAMGVVAELFASYPVMPFGLRLEAFSEYAMTQFQHRLDRLNRAAAAGLAEALTGLV
jgi:ribonucleoside-diphosphate reductase beta chain